MAMFDLEDSEEIRLENCRTDAGSILKGKKLKNVSAVDCEVVAASAQSNQMNGPRRALIKSVRWIMGIAATVIAAAVVSFLGLS